MKSYQSSLRWDTRKQRPIIWLAVLREGLAIALWLLLASQKNILVLPFTIGVLFTDSSFVRLG